MKVLVIPDVHGSHNWEQAKQIIDTVDKVVFIGDYVDSWENKWPDQGENLNNIFKFARENPDKVDVLWGNHDWSYFSQSRYGYQVSGHQPLHSTEISSLLNANKDILKVAVCYDDWVFSHAGITHAWVTTFKGDCEAEGIKFEEEDFFEQLNVAARNHVIDELFDWHGFFSGCGDEPCQGPLWVRPGSLLSNAEYPMQVVGHTEVVEGIDFFAQGKNGSRVIVVDSPDHSCLRILDTKKEYEFRTLLDLARLGKQKQKEINDAKSRAGQEE